MDIVIKAGDKAWRAELHDTPTGRLVAQALPIKGRASRWGMEIYFSIPVRTGLEEGATAAVSVGDLGYWPTGSAFCIFFGPTPASRGTEPKAASAVNVFGRVAGDLEGLDGVRDGEEVVIEALHPL